MSLWMLSLKLFYDNNDSKNFASTSKIGEGWKIKCDSSKVNVFNHCNELSPYSSNASLLTNIRAY